MGELLGIAIKGMLWTAGNWILIAMGMATATQFALWLGILSAMVQIGYTTYKWGKEVIHDIRSGKKKLPIPFKKRK